MKKIIYLAIFLLGACTNPSNSSIDDIEPNIETDITTNTQEEQEENEKKLFFSLEDIKNCNQYLSPKLKESNYNKLIYSTYNGIIGERANLIYMPCKNNKLISWFFTDRGIFIYRLWGSAFLLGNSIWLDFYANHLSADRDFSLPIDINFFKGYSELQFIQDDKGFNYALYQDSSFGDFFETNKNLEKMSQRNYDPLLYEHLYKLSSFKQALQQNEIVILGSYRIGSTILPFKFYDKEFAYKDLENYQNELTGIYYNQNGDILSLYPNNQLLILSYENQNLNFKYIGTFDIIDNQVVFKLQDVETDQITEISSSKDQIQIGDDIFTKYQFQNKLDEEKK